MKGPDDFEDKENFTWHFVGLTSPLTSTFFILLFNQCGSYNDDLEAWL